MTAALDARTRELLRQAADWRLIGLLFECPGAGWLQRLGELAAAVSDPALLAAAGQAREQASEGLYHSIFGPGGPAPPREVSYCDSVQLGLLMAELEAYYAAFACRFATGEAADHLSVEAGFVGFLRLKEAYARACGNPAQAEVAAEAAARFIDEHLSWIAEPLSAALGESNVGYLEAAGRALLERVGPARLRMPYPDGQPPLVEEEDISCCNTG